MAGKAINTLTILNAYDKQLIIKEKRESVCPQSRQTKYLISLKKL